MSEIEPIVFEPVVFNQFFQPIVGDDQTTLKSTEMLASYVGNHASETDIEDRYAWLGRGVSILMSSGAYSVPDLTMAERGHLVRSANDGMQPIVKAARGIGDVYATNVKAPQPQSRVRKNTRKILSNVYGLAFREGSDSFEETASLFRGTNPRNPISRYIATQLFYAQVHLNRVKMNIRTFEVEQDPEGQISLDFKHKVSPVTAESKKCPAVHARSGEEGKLRLSLLKFVGLIGEVALTKVYPHHFDIIDDTAELA